MDAFFASVEQRDHPEWRGKPLVVASPEARSVISAASYEARRYGVRSAMPSLKAIRLCPDLIFAPHRFDVYKEVSRQIQEIFLRYTDLVEPLSLDEAFLDVTHNHRGIASATLIAQEIKQAIWEELRLTASAGVSYNKFLAKIASDYQKPNGLFVITPNEGESFARSLSVDRFFGVGKVTLEQMNARGIYTGNDLIAYGRDRLVSEWGNRGAELYLNAYGIDERPVEIDYERKSVGVEYTLTHDTSDVEELRQMIKTLAVDLDERIRQSKFFGQTITLKIKYADFRTRSRSFTTIHFRHSMSDLYEAGLLLLSRFNISEPIRLVGLSVKQSGHSHRAFLYEQPEFDF